MVMYKIDRNNSPRRLAKLSRRLAWLLGVAAGLMLLMGAAVAINDWRNNNQANNQAAKSIARANRGVNNGTPSTTPVSADIFANYRVAPSQPRYIFIPKLKVKAIVLSLGTTKLHPISMRPAGTKTVHYLDKLERR